MGKIIREAKIDRKRERVRLRWQFRERDIQCMGSFRHVPETEVGRLAIGRNCFCCVVKDARSYRDKQLG